MLINGNGLQTEHRDGLILQVLQVQLTIHQLDYQLKDGIVVLLFLVVKLNIREALRLVLILCLQ